MGATSWLIEAKRLVTCDEARQIEGDRLGVIDAVAIAIENGFVQAIGDIDSLRSAWPSATYVDHRDGLVTPGLIDAHTHAGWVGSRAGEYVMRMNGADYEAIAKAGGGIVSSMHATRAAHVGELVRALAGRLARMASMGVTCVEVKSGYGLNEASERRQLEAMARLADRDDLPAAIPTFLGLHSVPPEFAGQRSGYIKACASWLDGIARDGLCRNVDAYIDRSAFSVAEARPMLEHARELGLGVRIHVGQFADIGGAELAAELGAQSADHLEHVSDDGASKLADAGVAAVLLPVASFTLDQSPPPIDRLRANNMSIVVASDANPGTAPTESLPLAMALAVRCYGLTVAEVLLGVTREAAKSLNLQTGVLAVGRPADLVLWDLTHEDALMQPWGVPRTRQVLRAGKSIASA